MNRLYVLAGAMALAVLVSATAQGQDEKKKKTPTIKRVMALTHGKNGFKGKFEAAVKDTKWEDATKIAKDWEKCAENLAKNEPPKGEKEDWEKASKEYVKLTKDLIEGSEKMDGDKVKAALKGVGGSCKSCHTAHKAK